MFLVRADIVARISLRSALSVVVLARSNRAFCCPCISSTYARFFARCAAMVAALGAAATTVATAAAVAAAAPDDDDDDDDGLLRETAVVAFGLLPLTTVAAAVGFEALRLTEGCGL
jgi:hypothetical protein